MPHRTASWDAPDLLRELIPGNACLAEYNYINRTPAEAATVLNHNRPILLVSLPSKIRVCQGPIQFVAMLSYGVSSLFCTLGLASLALSAAVNSNTAVKTDEATPMQVTPSCKSIQRHIPSGEVKLMQTNRQPLLSSAERGYLLGHYLSKREYLHYQAASVLEPRHKSLVLEPDTWTGCVCRSRSLAVL